MSYSFSVLAATKAAAKSAVAAKMAETAVAQKCHARDMVPAIAAANAFVDQLADDEAKDVIVTMSGSLMDRWDGSDVVHCESANVSVTASLAARAAPATA
jgi:hypothetical protein